MNKQFEFNKFHKDNPQIYALFQQEVFKAIRSGKKKLSARTIIEFIRWNIFLKTVNDEDYKINNNHIAYYARMFMNDHPEHEGIFELRTIANAEPVQGEFF